MFKMNKKELHNAFVSFILAAVLISGAIFVVTYEKKEKKAEVVDIQLSSDLVSTDSKVSAANFIKQNGTMGDISKDVTGENLVNGQTHYLSVQGRYKALEKVKTALVPGNLLITNREEKVIDSLATIENVPVFYEIKNLQVGEPTNSGEMIVYSDVGNTTYEYTEILVDFDSVRVWYQWGRDLDWDGTVNEIENVESFNDVKITLLKSGDLWFIYDIEDAEFKVNSRFATWSGLGDESYSDEDKIRRKIDTGINIEKDK